jgi:hypothetical protein
MCDMGQLGLGLGLGLGLDWELDWELGVRARLGLAALAGDRGSMGWQKLA